jgi:iduronate 2-sulfatase
MVGVVLSELDMLNLRNDTVVVVFGDHGWQLGENDEWSKFTQLLCL